MSQPQSGTTAPETTSPKLCIALVRGKVVSKARSFRDRDGSQRFATLVRLPNPDEFTSLGTVEVFSSERLGDVGDSWSGKVRISGSVRSFQYTDKATGEVKAGNDITIRLNAVE